MTKGMFARPCFHVNSQTIAMVESSPIYIIRPTSKYDRLSILSYIAPSNELTLDHAQQNQRKAKTEPPNKRVEECLIFWDPVIFWECLESGETSRRTKPNSKSPTSQQPRGRRHGRSLEIGRFKVAITSGFGYGQKMERNHVHFSRKL